MAFKLPDFLSRTDTKSRLLLLASVGFGIAGIVFVGSRFLGSGTKAKGSANVAAAPSGLQSVPGSQVSQEYYKALVQSNQQAAKKAQMTGGSAVPTMVNIPGTQQQTAPSSFSSNCGAICLGDDSDNVADDINSNLVKSNKLSQDDANGLLDRIKNNVPVAEFSASLDQLVRGGKLPPEDARRLMAEYKRHYANQTAAAGSKVIDDMMKAGLISVDTGSELVDLQKKNASAAENTAALNRLVSEGKLTAAQAAQLGAQYTQKQAQEALKSGAVALKQMAASGEITADVANGLTKLQERKISASDYDTELQKLVAAGKMTPAAMTKLQEQYRKQRTGLGPAAELKDRLSAVMLAASNSVNKLVAGSGMPAEAAAQLINLQKSRVDSADYQKALDQLVRDGKISADDSKRLMNDYNDAVAMSDAAADNIAKLAAEGKLSKEAASRLLGLQKGNTSADDYRKALMQLVKDGKLSPEEAKRLMDEYQGLQGLTAAAANNVNQLTSSGKLSQDDAAQLVAMQKSNVPTQEYQKVIDRLTQEGKLSPETAKRLMDEYKGVQGFAKEARKLGDLQANNASVSAYTVELKRAVVAGDISPEDAAQLLHSYQVATSPVAPGAGVILGADKNIPGSDDFSRLQQRLADQQRANVATSAIGPASSSVNQFNAAEAQAANEALLQHQQQIQDLMTGMKAQADKLVAAWQPPTMQYKAGAQDPKKSGMADSVLGSGQSANAANSKSPDAADLSGGAPLIKSGTILFATLDTAVDSDFPDTPVLATVVQGKYTGAKLLGKVTVGQGQGQDRVSLTFTLMDMDDWDKSKPVTAFAIDPDTAKTVLASNVDYHYFKRYGSIMATSFMTGYAKAITNAGTSATTLTGMSSTTPELSPTSKIAVGLGQVGTTLGAALQNNVNTLPTVKVNAGVALGILFMGDVASNTAVTEGPAAAATAAP